MYFTINSFSSSVPRRDRQTDRQTDREIYLRLIHSPIKLTFKQVEVGERKFAASGRVLKVPLRQCSVCLSVSLLPWLCSAFHRFVLCVCELYIRSSTTCVLDILFCCDTDYFSSISSIYSRDFQHRACVLMLHRSAGLVHVHWTLVTALSFSLLDFCRLVYKAKTSFSAVPASSARGCLTRDKTVHRSYSLKLEVLTQSSAHQVCVEGCLICVCVRLRLCNMHRLVVASVSKWTFTL